MFEWLSNLMNKPQIMWTPADKLFFILYIGGVLIVAFALIVAVGWIIDKIKNRRK